jgi:hypothetical protein
MTDFLSAATSFPTIIFTVLLGVVLVYWLIALFSGGLEVGTGGGGGGSLEALDGIGSGGGGFFSSIFEALGIGTVPTAIVASLLVVFAWFFSLVGTSFIDTLALSAGVAAVLTAGVVVTAMALSAVLTIFATKPIGRLFVHTEGQGRHSLVGRTCVVRTQRVDDSFGQAEVTDFEGASLVVDVRAANGHEFSRGDVALVIAFDDDADAFLIAPADQSLTP